MIDDGTQAYTFDEANRLKTAGSYFYTYSGLENKRVITYDNTIEPDRLTNRIRPESKDGVSTAFGAYRPSGSCSATYSGICDDSYRPPSQDSCGPASNNNYLPDDNPFDETNNAEADYAVNLPWGGGLPPDNLPSFLPAATIGAGAGGVICVGSGICEVAVGAVVCLRGFTVLGNLENGLAEQSRRWVDSKVTSGRTGLKLRSRRTCTTTFVRRSRLP